MATGDTQDIVQRIRRLIPSWFGDDTPILNALLTGFAMGLGFIHQLYSYAQLQTRIQTATDGWLDMVAADFFGASLQRKPNQADDAFRKSIQINLFRERSTRNSVIQVLTDLTGRAPVVFEPQRPMDTGCYGGPGLGYALVGGYGSLALVYQAFITAYRPSGTGIPVVAGYNAQTGGYAQITQVSLAKEVRNFSNSEYADIDSVLTAITDADIYAAIDSVKPVGTVLWTKITN